MTSITSSITNDNDNNNNMMMINNNQKQMEENDTGEGQVQAGIGVLAGGGDQIRSSGLREKENYEFTIQNYEVFQSSSEVFIWFFRFCVRRRCRPQNLNTYVVVDAESDLLVLRT